MSQFQQPKQPAPGVVDLGTGRQARMSQSNMNAGAFGSRGVTGGQSLRGTDSAVRANTIDPVSYLLGSTAEGMKSFVQSKELVKSSYERKAKETLANAEKERLADEQNSNLSPEQVTDAHLKRLQKLRDENAIDRDLDAHLTLNQEISRVQGLDDKDSAEDLRRRMQEELVDTAWSQVEQLKVLKKYEAEAKKNPKIFPLVRADIDRARGAAEIAKANRDYGHAKKHAVDALTAAHDERFASPNDILTAMQSHTDEDGNPDPISIDDPDRLFKMTQMYYGEFMQGILDNADPEDRNRLERDQFEIFAQLVEDDIQAVDDLLTDNERSLEKTQATHELTVALETASTIGSPMEALYTATTWSTNARAAYAQQDPSKRPPLPDFIRGLFLTEGVTRSANSRTPLRAFQRMRNSLPTDLNDAYSLGWVPSAAGKQEPGLTQEQWESTRREILGELRVAQLKVAAPAFKSRLQAVDGDLESIMGVAGDLADMAGVAIPQSIFEDPDQVLLPEGLPMAFGEEFNGIFGSISAKAREAVKDAQRAEAAGNEVTGESYSVNMINSGGGAASSDMRHHLSQQDTLPTTNDIVRSDPVNGANLVTDYDSFLDFKKRAKQWYTNDEGQIWNQKTADFLELLDRLDDKYLADPTGGEDSFAKIRGILQAANAILVHQTMGESSGSDAGTSLFGDALISQVREVFDNTDGGPLSDPADVEFISYLWNGLEKEPDLRDELFDDNTAAASLTANLYDNLGTFNSDTLDFRDENDQPVLLSNAAVDLAGTADTWARLTGNGPDPEMISRDVLDILLTPQSAEGMKKFNTVTKDDQLIAIVTAVNEEAEDTMDALAKQLGIDPKESPNWAQAVETEFPDIAQEAALYVTNAVQNSQEDLIGNNQKLAGIYRTGIQVALERRFRGKAYINGTLQDDPTGSIKKAMTIAGSMKPQDLWTVYGGARLGTIVERMGMDPVILQDDSKMQEQFYRMFPDFADDEVEATDLMVRAREIAGSNDLSLNHVLKASLELSPEGRVQNPDDLGYRATSDQTFGVGARFETRGREMDWVLPGQGGGAATFTFIPPVNLDTMRAVSMDYSAVGSTTREKQNEIFFNAFNKVDADQDGVLSQAEIDAYNETLPMTEPGAISRALGVKPRRKIGIRWKAGEKLGDRTYDSTRKKDDAHPTDVAFGH